MSFLKPDIPDEDRTGSQKYVGNIWGWKFSIFSFFLILFMVILMAVRYNRLPPEQRQYSMPDSLAVPVNPFRK
jgi:predicted MFS family arabinose efflux permease